MTVKELIETLEDFDENLEVRLALQPHYPMCGSIRNICHDQSHGENRLLIACSDNEDYGCPSAAWDETEIYDDDEDCE